MNQLSEPPAVAEPSYVACLYLANAKGSRPIDIYGKAGKRYKFLFSAAHRKHVREYVSMDQFRREELDMRKNTMQKFEICTLIGGAVDPVGSAIEAVELLINERLKVSGSVKQAALARLAKMIFDAIEKPVDSDRPLGIPQFVTLPDHHTIPAGRVTLERPAETLPGGQSLLPASEPSTPALIGVGESTPTGSAQSQESTASESTPSSSPDLTTPIQFHNNRDLTRMKIDPLRDLGKQWGATTTMREALVEFILAKQTEFPEREAK